METEQLTQTADQIAGGIVSLGLPPQETIALITLVIDKVHDTLPKGHLTGPTALIYASLLDTGRKEDNEGKTGTWAEGKVIGWGANKALKILKEYVQEKIQVGGNPDVVAIFEALADALREKGIQDIKPRNSFEQKVQEIMTRNRKRENSPEQAAVPEASIDNPQPEQP